MGSGRVEGPTGTKVEGPIGSKRSGRPTTSKVDVEAPRSKVEGPTRSKVTKRESLSLDDVELDGDREGAGGGTGAGGGAGAGALESKEGRNKSDSCLASSGCPRGSSTREGMASLWPPTYGWIDAL
jgi:hypothetical protein